MNENKYTTIQQHEPLRVPSNWNGQEKKLIVQLEEILDDIYRRFGRLRLEDLRPDLRKTIMETVDGYSSFEQTVEGFRAEVADAKGNASEALQTANSFEQRIKNAEGDSSEALQTANSFSNRISTAEGNATEALQTANSFERRVSDAEDNASEAIQTATSFEQRLADAEGYSSEAIQTAKRVESKIEGIEGQADYVQFQEPQGDEIGDTWTQIAAPPLTWNDLKGMTWNDIRKKKWGEIYYNNVAHYVWDGKKWVKMLDEQERLKSESRIQQESDKIALRVEQVAEQEPQTLRNSKVLVTLEGIQLGTTGVFIVDSGNFEIDSDGNVTLKGKIFSGEGDIGGWKIAPGNLSSGSGTKHVRLSTEDATYAIWAGAEAGGNAPFRVTPDGEVYMTRLYVTDENGVAQQNPVNLSGNFWKMDKAYSSNVTSARATNNSDGTTTITFSTRGGESFDVNFRKADYSRLELRQSDPQGRGVFVYDPSKHTYNVQKTVQAYDNNAYIGIYETINETSGTEAYDDGYNGGYGTGYNSGFEDGKDAYQPTSITRTGYGSDGKSIIAKAANSHQDVLTNQTVDATGVYNNGWNACIDNCSYQSDVYRISQTAPGTLYMRVGDSYSSVGSDWVRTTRATGLYAIPSKI